MTVEEKKIEHRISSPRMGASSMVVEFTVTSEDVERAEEIATLIANTVKGETDADEDYTQPDEYRPEIANAISALRSGAVTLRAEGYDLVSDELMRVADDLGDIE